ncbi:GtrA family protein [Escherichia coli]|uniref:GtrA family protein n=1 Tax=Escherichia coli TaxID=562 RepID=UPI000DA4A81C|nr:GtrA family protein [Escherichia coli]HCH8949329.1 GtrA family protein [Shigella flexneri]EAB6803427.1 GtrA family protein [Escherichia coli]EEX0336004.1 GtrA family protein [Escherichia coli]EEX0383433.1 GtrA family protein [Escherichia coli]EFF0540586.1 GtrA family protein [Escherichia coli]
MLKVFSKYISIGIINTLIHWTIFAILIAQGVSQSISNLIAFLVAVSFSFVANAKWTFKSNATGIKYFFYVSFLGIVALTLGMIADKLKSPPIITLIFFSSISLVIGFIYSKYFVFRR